MLRLIAIISLISLPSFAQTSDAPVVENHVDSITARQIKEKLCTNEAKYNKEKEAVGRVLIAKDAEIKKLQDSAGVPVWVVVLSVGVGVLVGATAGGIIGAEVQKGKKQ